MASLRRLGERGAVRLLAERNRGRPTVETPAGSDVSAPRPPTGTPSRRARGAPRSRGTSSAHRDLRGCRIGGEELRGRTAREVFVKVWRWLVRHGYLERERLPIRYGSRSRKRYVVAGEPVHPTGRHFVNPAEIAPGIWVETNKSQERMARELRLAFEDFGVEAELLWRP